ncbi:unnamed protein product [Cylindrotheca closterium]|uniref:Uncharacterized protein n=1 Tax=Cylindrotheca closterium TaxID=2856 RepID=A0AAD2CJM2_9STRA|nr:unnamed protein product [Cylindrotheca closterium]
MVAKCPEGRPAREADELEDEMFDRMFKKIKARQDADYLMDEDYQEHEWITANEDMDYEEYESELDNEETKQMLDKLAAELVELGKPYEEEVLFEFDDDTQEDVAVNQKRKMVSLVQE